MRLQKVLFILFLIVAILCASFFLIQKFINKDPAEPISCGGFVGAICPSGFYCQYPNPSYPDAMGQCKMRSWKAILSIFANGPTPLPQENEADNKPQNGNQNSSQNHKDDLDISQGGTKPLVGEDGTITRCVEIDEYNNCLRVETILSVKQFIDGGVVRGEDVKVKGIADKSSAMCTLMGCGVGSCCNSCTGSVVIKDSLDKSFKKVISNLLIQGSTEKLSCRGNECTMTCKGPLQIGQEYIFTGVLDGEAKYYDNGEPYIIDTFVIKSYEQEK